MIKPYPKITAEIVQDCLAEMSPEGRAGIEQLMTTFETNYKNLPHSKAFGRLSGLELIGCLTRYLVRPKSEKYGLLDSWTSVLRKR